MFTIQNQEESIKNETIQYFLSGCEAMVAKEYKERHETVGQILNQEPVKDTIEEIKHCPAFNSNLSQ